MDSESEVIALLGTLAENARWKVADIGNGFWVANQIDDQGMTYRGTVTFVCPDGQIIVVSSNPLVHNFEIALDVIRRRFDTNELSNTNEVLSEIYNLTQADHEK